jgi:ferredoxin
MVQKCLAYFTLILFIAGLYVFAGLKKHSMIDPAKCNGDALCVEVCPVEAISETKYNNKKVYVIDIKKCTNCGACIQVCPVKAIHPDSTDLSAKKTALNNNPGAAASVKQPDNAQPVKDTKKQDAAVENKKSTTKKK